jgi:hypothetical protein
MGTWHLRFEVSATSLAVALLEHAMVDCHLDWWQFNYLLGVIGAQGYQGAMATGTGAGRNEMDLGRAQ